VVSDPQKYCLENVAMLVLTRKVNESIAIGDSILLTVLAIEGEKVKIGITAPRETVILRQEVFQAIQDQRKIQELMANESETETFDELRKLLASESGDEPEEEDKGDSETS
jgi:carbon storage regulator